jgi:uncharacterized protein
MRKLSLSTAVLVLGALLSLTSLQGWADAEKKIVLQLSDGSAEKQTLVLNVANNLQKAYGAGNVDVEIVTFGPGLRLLFADNVNKNRIDSLAQTGVRFAACQNTSKKMTQILGHPPKLNEHSVVVAGGVTRIVDLVKEGYVLIRP